MSRDVTALANARTKSVRRAAASFAPDEEQLARDLSLMLRSGLTLLDSLKTSAERAEDKRARLVQQILRRLREGDSFSAALQASAPFSLAFVACVRSSEASGDLAESLQRFADNAARIRQMKSKLVSSLVYPVLLLAVAMMVVLFLLVFVVPRFASVLEGSQQAMPLLSRWLILVASVLHELPLQVWLVLAGLAAFGMLRGMVAARERRLEALLTSLAARIPGVRPIVLAFARGQFARSASMLVRSGLPALKALAMCSDLLLSADREGLRRALASASHGAPLAGTLFDEGLVDPLGLRILKVSEQSGELDTALDRLADIHEYEVSQSLERAGRLVEPVLMLGIGLVVGGIVVLMYMPIFQLATSVH